MTTTAPKHTPATPLRITVSHGYVVTTYAAHGAGFDARLLAKVENGCDAPMQAWCDIANAYPKLVEALRNVLAKDGNGLRTTGELPARALLRELGEAE